MLCASYAHRIIFYSRQNKTCMTHKYSDVSRIHIQTHRVTIKITSDVLLSIFCMGMCVCVKSLIKLNDAVAHQHSFQHQIFFLLDYYFFFILFFQLFVFVDIFYSYFKCIHEKSTLKRIFFSFAFSRLFFAPSIHF